MTEMPSDKIRIEQWPDGWRVIDGSVEPHEINNWGIIASGCPDEADAQACLEDYALEQQCLEWEMHSRQDDPAEECPF